MLLHSISCMISSNLKQEVCEQELPLTWTIAFIEMPCHSHITITIVGHLAHRTGPAGRSP